MKLNPDKYKKEITLLCPVCGNSEMGNSEESEIVKCTDCGNELTKDELIQENGPSIDAHVNEIKKELTRDIQKQLKNLFKKSFK